MKIVSGLGSIDEYISFVEAGADEFFCGYVPDCWAQKYGILQPLNRREVLYYNVQLGAMSELKILRKMVECYGVPVHLTFNSLYYTPEQYPVIADIISQCMDCGFETFIIADPALIVYLRRQKIPCR
ncbi:MAG: peptidase U32, partial [Robinsoniella sp.]|nr:peptidase U32 [Robinsoniella sp.]